MFEGVTHVICSTGTTAFPSRRWDGDNTPERVDWEGVRNLVSALPRSLSRIILVSSVGVTKSNELPWRSCYTRVVFGFMCLIFGLVSYLTCQPVNITRLSPLLMKAHEYFFLVRIWPASYFLIFIFFRYRSYVSIMNLFGVLKYKKMGEDFVINSGLPYTIIRFVARNAIAFNHNIIKFRQIGFK
ncbi:putative NAD(P)-binding domain superfamily [Helianthus annuus]|nr:putative NAD(P)-binding domain superfamily [Helianthus annuus]